MQIRSRLKSFNIIYGLSSNFKKISSEKNVFLILGFFVHRLFEEHSELIELFEKFNMLKTKEQQEESLELAEHATIVMNTLDNAIRSLDNPDAFFQFLEQVGASHRRIPGFSKEHFRVRVPFPLLVFVFSTVMWSL